MLEQLDKLRTLGLSLDVCAEILTDYKKLISQDLKTNLKDYQSVEQFLLRWPTLDSREKDLESRMFGLLQLIQKSDPRDLFSLDEQTASPQKLDVQFVDQTSRTSFVCRDILANFDTVVCLDGLFYCGWTKGKNPLSFENRVLLKSFTGLDLDDYLPNSHIFEEYNRLFNGQAAVGVSWIYKDGVKILRDEQAQVFVRKTNIRLGKLGCRGTFREWYLLKGYRAGYYWPEKKYGLLNLMLQTPVSQDQDTQLITSPTEKKIIRLGVRYTADVCMKVLCTQFVKESLTFLEFVKQVVGKLQQTGIRNEMDIHQDLVEIYEIAKLGHQYLPIPVLLQPDSVALLGSLTLNNVIKL